MAAASPDTPPGRTLQPLFPGGMEIAPEAGEGGCGHSPCLCLVPPGREYCCRACARAPADHPGCPCGHFGCADRYY